jgi:hypothetical protein
VKTWIPAALLNTLSYAQYAINSTAIPVTALLEVKVEDLRIQRPTLPATALPPLSEKNTSWFLCFVYKIQHYKNAISTFPMGFPRGIQVQLLTCRLLVLRIAAGQWVEGALGIRLTRAFVNASNIKCIALRCTLRRKGIPSDSSPARMTMLLGATGIMEVGMGVGTMAVRGVRAMGARVCPTMIYQRYRRNLPSQRGQVLDPPLAQLLQ